MKEVIIYGIMDIVSKGINFILSPILTRVLTQNEYGAVALVSTINALLSIIWYVGADWAFPFFKSMSKPAQINHTIRVSTCIALAGVFLTTLVFSVISSNTEIIKKFTGIYSLTTLYLISFFFLISGVQYWFAYILRFMRRATNYVVVTLIAGSVPLFIFFPLVYVFPKLNHLTLFYFCFCVMAFISAFLGYHYINKDGKALSLKKLKFDKKLTYKMLEYGLPLMFAGSLYTIITQTSRFILGILTNPADVAIYYLASMLSSIILTFKLWFSTAWEPYLVDIISNQQPFNYVVEINRIFKFIVISLFGLSALASIWISNVVELIYPQSYYKSSLIVPPLLLAQSFQGLSTVANVSALIARTYRFHLPVYSIALIFNFLVSYLLIKIYGILGAAYGYMLTELLIFIMWTHIGKRVLGNLQLDVRSVIVFIVLCSAFSLIYSIDIYAVHYSLAIKVFFSVIIISLINFFAKRNKLKLIDNIIRLVFDIMKKRMNLEK
jgi:O-antigen/teichoic acid export membrane protein